MYLKKGVENQGGEVSFFRHPIYWSIGVTLLSARLSFCKARLLYRNIRGEIC